MRCDAQEDPESREERAGTYMCESIMMRRRGRRSVGVGV
jgi:hypothetical protein